jgi:Protein of unknown function (DUF1615)
MLNVSRRARSGSHVARAIALAVVALLIAACTSPPRKPVRPPEQVHSEVLRLLPARAPNREAWAAAVTDAFFALDIEPSTSHLCGALAVAEQESNFVADPEVPGLGRIARAEIERRAEAHHVPRFMLDAALAIRSSNGMSYAERIAVARTERELSLVYDDLIDRVPLGQRLFADANPVKTAGPMQVSVVFAEQYARSHRYPYARVPDEPLRNAVFTLRGGVYFGIAHLLGKPVSYDRMIYRFADYNAGFYASRNAAFQSAVAIASGKSLTLDGDLVDYSGSVGQTELALRTLAHALDLSSAQIRHALDLGESPEFETTALYERVYALANKRSPAPLPHAMIPQIDLSSPKITRKLTTQWFAERVQQRYRACLARDGHVGA